MFGLTFLALAPGCDVRALRQGELTAQRDAAAADVRSDQAGADRRADDGLDAPLEVGDDAGTEPAETGADIEGRGEGRGPVDLGGDDDGGSDGRPACPSTPCEDYETCDVSSRTCTPRVGRGMIGGSVTDGCTGRGLDARVAIAGRRQCSVDNKGSYFFANLPEGNLALIAFKEGYKLYESTVNLTALGVVRNIVLQPDTADGCAGPSVVSVACVCAIAGCP